MNLKESVQFAPLDKTHSAFQQEMFYESLFVPPGDPPYPQDIIQKPDLQKYWQDWGGPTDIGILAMLDQIPIGAVWARYSSAEDPGYGYVSVEYPELGIALKDAYRSHGIGTRLMGKIFIELKAREMPGVSLSADIRNKAMNLYIRMGFNIVSQEDQSVVMLKTFV